MCKRISEVQVLLDEITELSKISRVEIFDNAIVALGEIFLKAVEAKAIIETDLILGTQEPPDDPRIFNRRQPDGTYRPISEFFDSAVA